MSRFLASLGYQLSCVAKSIAFGFCYVALVNSSHGLSAAPLDSYYVHYCRLSPNDCRYYPAAIPTLQPPIVESRSIIETMPGGRGFGVYFFANFLDVESPLPFLGLRSEGSSGSQCEILPRPQTLAAGSTTQRLTYWTEVAAGDPCFTLFPGSTLGEWRFSDQFFFGAPVRRKAADGSEFEASPMVQTREGRPWLTTYWGYRLGLVESQFDWNPTQLMALPAFAGWPRFAPKSEEFVLVALPPPIVEGEVTEYVNTLNFPNSPGGQYFYASNDAERQILDSGLPGKWVRTGKSFKHGGYVSVCRFYGSPSPGPNTHFYSASDEDCRLLKSLEISPRPTDRQQMNYEGIAFYANLPIASQTAGAPPTCPTGSIPLYRIYNAAWGPAGKRNFDSNHRYTTDASVAAEMTRLGWVNEGIKMCVPQ